jgi:hypothetical protein
MPEIKSSQQNSILCGPRGEQRKIRTSVADRSYDMISADAATVHEVISEDLYDLE